MQIVILKTNRDSFYYGKQHELLSVTLSKLHCNLHFRAERDLALNVAPSTHGSRLVVAKILFMT